MFIVKEVKIIECYTSLERSYSCSLLCKTKRNDSGHSTLSQALGRVHDSHTYPQLKTIRTHNPVKISKTSDEDDNIAINRAALAMP